MLSRLFAAGIPSPEPIILKSHVLVMRFLGTNGTILTKVQKCNHVMIYYMRRAVPGHQRYDPFNIAIT